jgi:hypothetical protein
VLIIYSVTISSSCISSLFIEGLIIPVLPSVVPVVSVFSIKKTETTGTTDGKLEVMSPPIKRLEQEKLLMVKLEVISTP